MKAAGLFAGIGGFEQALASAGIETALLADIDSASKIVLRAHFPSAEVLGDVTDIPKLPDDIGILVAGFPCQNLSMAGDKTGINGPKSKVVRHIFELIGKNISPTVVIENVPFMLHLDRGQAMQWLVERFEAIGYRWAYRVLDTAGFGLPQRRRRVYFVASKTIDPARALFGAGETKAVEQQKPTIDKPIGFYWTEGRSGVGLTRDGFPPIKSGSGIGIASPPAVLFPTGEVLLPSIEAAEALQGFQRGWTAAAEASGRNARWRLVGNAVSVPVARWVVDRMVDGHETGAELDGAAFDGAKWPNAAHGGRGRRQQMKVSERPQNLTAPSVEAFRDASWSPLSLRALKGFIARAEEGGLTFPSGFLDALRTARDRS